MKIQHKIFFQRRLLKWYDQFGRHNLPWQINKTPYKVWLSEIMLQQTQVVTVIPYYKKFMLHFPTIHHLAKAPLESILKYWAGLGYYRRAKNLHTTAKLISNNFSGLFPQDLNSLISLPGIGQSTAGAILSLGMNKKAAICDGNVKRVMSRFFLIKDPINTTQTQKELWTLTESVLPNKRFADFNQALMDMGATCCTKSKPNCNHCLLDERCGAYNNNLIEQIPAKISKSKKKPVKSTHMLVCYTSDHKVLLLKNPDSGIWPNLWVLPQIEKIEMLATYLKQAWNLQLTDVKYSNKFNHHFSHYTLVISPIFCAIKSIETLADGAQTQQWVNIQQINNKGIPRAIQKIMDSYSQYLLTKEAA